MIKRFVSILLLLCLLPTTGCAAEHTNEPELDEEAHYMHEMIVAAEAGDLMALQQNLDARNARLAIDDRTDEQLTLEEFLGHFEDYAGFSMQTDYLLLMMQCCISGDLVTGLEAESKRNLKIDTLGMDKEKISLQELRLLSKLITAEAGSAWLPMDWKLMVGEVVMNRVASPEFPNTMDAVVYQEGQYANVNTRYFKLLTPFWSCVEAAARVLSGERVMNDPTVVFQSKQKQGSVHSAMYDSIYGYTYFCRSNHPELYADGGEA